MSFLSNLNWRYATKIFDKDKKISDEVFAKILESAQMTPTSFGLQPFEIHIITDKKKLLEIQPFCWDQPQISSCSHLLIFCAKENVSEKLEKYCEIAKLKNLPPENLKGFEEMVLKNIDKLDLNWAKNQAFIALGFVMAACTELKIDTCAIGGFLPHKIDENLNLDKQTHSTVLLSLGYRTEDPKFPKVRFSQDDLFK